MRFRLCCEGTARHGCGYTEDLSAVGHRLFHACPQCGRKQRRVLVTVVDDGEVRTYGYQVGRTRAVADPVVLGESHAD